MAVFGTLRKPRIKKECWTKILFSVKRFTRQRLQTSRESYKDPMTALYLLFFQSSNVTFTNFNKFLQREEPSIYSIYNHLQTFVNKLASKFIKHNVIHELIYDKKTFTKPDILLECQKDDNDLFINFVTNKILKKLFEGEISTIEADRFFDIFFDFLMFFGFFFGVRAFYKAEY